MVWHKYVKTNLEHLGRIERKVSMSKYQIENVMFKERKLTEIEKKIVGKGVYMGRGGGGCQEGRERGERRNL